MYSLISFSFQPSILCVCVCAHRVANHRIGINLSPQHDLLRVTRRYLVCEASSLPLKSWMVGIAPLTNKKCTLAYDLMSVDKNVCTWQGRTH